MLDIIIKNICENSNKIDAVAKYAKKSNNRIGLQIILLCVGLYTVTKTVKNHEKEIRELKTKLESIEDHFEDADIEIAKINMTLENKE